MQLNSELGITFLPSSWKTVNVGTRAIVARRIAGIFSQKLNVEAPAYDSDLFESGTLDSLQLVELIAELEQEFGIRVPLGESDLEDFRSIESITLLLTREIGNGAHA